MKTYQRVVALAAIIGLTLFFVWAQRELHLNPGDILQDAIVDEGDLYMRQNAAVEELGFYGNDVIAFAVTGREFNQGLIEQYRELGDKIKQHFPDGRFSLAEIPDFEVEPDGSTSTRRYLSSNLSVEELRDRLTTDDVMKHILFTEDLTTLVHLVVTTGMSESEVYDKAKAILEERKVSTHERLFTYDIHPTERMQNVSLLGWILGRREVSQMLPIENVRFVSIGIFVVCLILFISTRSLKLALAGVTLIGCSLLWMRGGIAVVGWLTLFMERGYVIIGAASTLVVGSSLILAVIWYLRAKDEGERELLVLLMFLAVVMGLGNQLSLYYSFQIRAIRELAVYGILGMLAIAALAWYGLRAIVTHVPSDEERASKLTSAVQRAIGYTASHQPTAHAAMLTIAFCIGAGVAAFPLIPRGTDALRLIAGTYVEQSFQRMQQAGLWADGLSVAVTPREASDKEAYLRPEFLEQSLAFVHDIEALPTTRSVGTILKQVTELSQAYYGQPTPRTERQARRIFVEIDHSNPPLGVLESLYNEHGLQLFVLAKQTNTSEDVRLARAGIEAVASRYPGLVVQFGGMSALYARTSEMVVEGKLWNLVTQIPWNWCGFLLAVTAINQLARRRGYTRGQVSAWRMATVMSIPFVFATATFFVFMAAWGVRLDQANAAILNMASNAAIDFTLYWSGMYLLQYAKTGSTAIAKEATLKIKGEHVLTDVALNCVCFFPLVFSGFKTIGELGWQVPLMLVLVALAVLFFTIPLFERCVIRRLTIVPNNLARRQAS